MSPSCLSLPAENCRCGDSDGAQTSFLKTWAATETLAVDRTRCVVAPGSEPVSWKHSRQASVLRS